MSRTDASAPAANESQSRNSTILYALRVRSSLITPRKLSEHHVTGDYDSRERFVGAYVFAPEGDELSGILSRSEEIEIEERGEEYVAKASLVGVTAMKTDVTMALDRTAYWKDIPIEVLHSPIKIQ
jgi:hypothetical protein